MMCGRFTLRTPTKAIAEAFGLTDAPDLKPRYNIAPTQQVAAIRLDPEHRNSTTFDAPLGACSELGPTIRPSATG